MYDPAIIEEFASRLLKKAKVIFIVSAVLGAIIGAGGAYGAAQASEALGVYAPWLQLALVASGAFLGAMVGLYIGRERAFHYRLVAQTAMCQVNIENNTRVTVEIMSQWGTGSQQRASA